MKHRPSNLMLLMFALGMAGLALFVFLLTRHNLHTIKDALLAAGWSLILIVILHAFLILLDTLAWHALLPKTMRHGILYLYTWIGEAVQTLLPVAQVGGDILRARLATTYQPKIKQNPSLNIEHGLLNLSERITPPVAASTILVDITLSLLVQLIYTLTGLALLLLITGDSSLNKPILMGTLLGVLAAGAFFALQRMGIFPLLRRLINRLGKSQEWQGFLTHTESLDHQVRDLYSQPKQLFLSGCYTMLCFMASAGEIYIALKALGLPGSFAAAYVFESIARAIRSAAFLVPGTLGLQEGGYIVVGALLGISPESALTLALIRRVRELAIGIPGLLAWQFVEGHLFWRRQASKASPEAATPSPTTP